MKRDLTIALAALALAGTFAVLGKHDERPAFATRASGDASFGGVLAMYELLRAEGRTVTRFRQPHVTLADAHVDTLVAFDADAPSAAAMLDTSAIARLRQDVQGWVRAGGRLVTENAHEPLYERKPRTGSKPTLPTLVKHARAKGVLRGPWSAEVRTLRGFGADRFAVRRSDEVLLADGGGPLVVRVRDGKGDVTAVASAVPFENRHLGEADNARLAYLLTAPRHGGAIAFDEAAHGDVVMRPWFTALDVPERLGLALLALAGLLWLAHGALRLGPPVRLLPEREPTSAEFLAAVAALYRRAGARSHAAAALLLDARRRTERAPRTAENAARAAAIEAASARHVEDDATLVAFARLTRTTREDALVREHRRTRRRSTPA